MAHPIPANQNPLFKKGDRVQHNGTGTFATVVEDQTDPLIIKINWDERSEGPQDYRADAFRVAPWHGIKDPWFPLGFVVNLELIPDTERLDGVDPVHVKNFFDAGLLGGAVKANPASVTPIHKIGDRVKLKYNRSCGTVKANAFPGDRTVPVEWDKAPGIKAIEELADLVVLYAPRDTDPVNPNQEAIDAIEVQRQVLIKEVNAVQARLRSLTTAKKLLERG